MLYPIRVVTIRAITDNYCNKIILSLFFVTADMLKLKEILDHITQLSLSKKNATGAGAKSELKKISRQISMLQIAKGIQKSESKTSPRHLNFLKQLRKTTEKFRF